MSLQWCMFKKKKKDLWTATNGGILSWLSHLGLDFRLPGEAQMCAVIRSRASHHRGRGRESHVTGRLQSMSAKSSEVGQSVWWDKWRRVRAQAEYNTVTHRPKVCALHSRTDNNWTLALFTDKKATQRVSSEKEKLDLCHCIKLHN